jgi:hypothetical protein
VTDAPSGTRFILEAQQEIGVIEEFAIENFERHRAVPHPNLLGEKDRAHAPCAQAANKAETAGQPSGKLRLGFRGLGGELSAVSWTVGEIVRVSILASGAGFHERKRIPPAGRILTDALP